MKQFPIVKASGSNYEVGLTIGKQLKETIRLLLATNKKYFIANFDQFLKTSEAFQKQTQKYFPQFMEELRGIAEGADVSFAELFLSNNREVADFNPKYLDPGHCTIVGIPQKNGYLLGHNEDWAQTSLTHLYLLDAKINGIKIFGLNYANNIIGDSVAVNGYDLAEAVNELSHTDTQIGVPKNFIARAILDCKTLEEVERIITTIPRAGGYNHVLTQGNRLWNIESSAKEHAIQKIESQKYVHTNHYVTELKRIDRGNAESKKRYEKVSKQLPNINSVEDIKKLLSDTSTPPICRTGTIGSVIIDSGSHQTHIAYGQPTIGSYNLRIY